MDIMINVDPSSLRLMFAVLCTLGFLQFFIRFLHRK